MPACANRACAWVTCARTVANGRYRKVGRGGESSGVCDRERGSTWARVRERALSTSTPMLIIPLTHASSSPREKRLLRANGQGSPLSGPRVRRSRYRGALLDDGRGPLDRRLCVATFRWFCLCRIARGGRCITMSTIRRDESLTVVERARLKQGTTLFKRRAESDFSGMCQMGACVVGLNAHSYIYV
jgi:hypothetical protein